MSELRLFTLTPNGVQELPGRFYKLEKEIQNLFEKNLEALLGVRFVASEFQAGPGNRIDTLGIDENGFPVVIEYKLDKNKTVINQGVAYLAWIRNNPDSYWKAVLNKLGREIADSIDYSSVRLICIAAEFTRDDLGMYELMPNLIDLVRYRRFGDRQILLERVSTTDTSTPNHANIKQGNNRSGPDKPFTQVLEEANPITRDIFSSLQQTLLSQGEDVTEKSTKLYMAYKRTRNFATIVAKKDELLLYLHVDPDTVDIRDGLRDVRNIGHWGTGSLEVRIRSKHDIEVNLPIIQRAYEGEIT